MISAGRVYIGDHESAMAHFDGIMDRMRREIEVRVAEDYKEARRLEPGGVLVDDLTLVILKALREWRP